MVDVDTRYIMAAPITSQKAPQLVKEFQECYEELKSKGIIAQMVCLDNEINIPCAVVLLVLSGVDDCG